MSLTGPPETLKLHVYDGKPQKTFLLDPSLKLRPSDLRPLRKCERGLSGAPAARGLESAWGMRDCRCPSQRRAAAAG